LVLISLGRVKNDNSGWGEAGRFDWGHAPVIMKRLGAEITVSGVKDMRVYQLENDGARGKEISVTRGKNGCSFSTGKARSPWFEILLR
jgi:hypothetical protein